MHDATINALRNGALIGYPPQPARQPVSLCAECHYPLSDHADGICPDGDGTYRYLCLGTFAESVVADVPDAWGAGLYLFWIEDTFSPPVYTVRGETFTDAYEWFVDYAAGRGLLAQVDPADAMPEGTDGAEWIDGAEYWTENVNGRAIVEGSDR